MAKGQAQAIQFALLMGLGALLGAPWLNLFSGTLVVIGGAVLGASLASSLWRDIKEPRTLEADHDR